MSTRVPPSPIVNAGDRDGLLDVYDTQGCLVLSPGELTLKMSPGWDMSAQTPWRRLMPKVIFLGYGKPASSRLYVTTLRIVLVRDIDSGRETVGDMTPLGMPNAVAKTVELRKLKQAGIREFCELHPASMKVSRLQRAKSGRTWLRLDVRGSDGKQYALSFWKTDGEDPEMLSLIESRFKR